jgi:imidazole glycerol-phosphate synthase subunit HisF
MNVARVIPCLDVTGGRVVKGTNFVDLRDAGDPVELAARYDAEGADELVFLDITASSDDRETTVDMVYRVAEQVFIPFTVGGGIRSLEDDPAHAARRCRQGQRQHRRGAAPRVIARSRPSSARSASCVRSTPSDRSDATAGSRCTCTAGAHRPGSTPSSGRPSAVELGAGEILLTSMDRDGTRAGFDSSSPRRSVP